MLLVPTNTPVPPSAGQSRPAVLAETAAADLLCGVGQVLVAGGFSTALLGDRVLANRRLTAEAGTVELLGHRYEVEVEGEGPLVLRLSLVASAAGPELELSTRGFSLKGKSPARLEDRLMAEAERAAASAPCAGG